MKGRVEPAGYRDGIEIRGNRRRIRVGTCKNRVSVMGNWSIISERKWSFWFTVSLGRGRDTLVPRL